MLIRELTTDDYLRLARFNANFLEDHRSETEWLARLRYWWDQNPAYNDSWKRGFILLDGEEIVGFVGSFPTFFKTEDMVITVFNGTTWRVYEPYRRFSIDLWEKNREVSKHYLSFNTTPTSSVSKLITRIGYERYSWGENSVSFLIGNGHLFAQSIRGKFPALLKVIGTYAAKLWQLRLNFLYTNKSIVSSILRDDNDLDKLWRRTKDQFANTNLRSKQTVEWYSINKTIKYVYHGSDLVAYGIYLYSFHVDKASRYATMTDFWYDDKADISFIVNALIKSDLLSMRLDKSVTSMRYPHYSTEFGYKMGKLGMLKHQYDSTGYFRPANGTSYKFSLENTYLTLLQGDFGT